MTPEVNPESLEAYAFRRETHPEALERVNHSEWPAGEAKVFERVKVFAEGVHLFNGFVEVKS